MRIYEWNIHMSATIPSNNSYDLKDWIIEEITHEDPDCFVLTEFVVSTGIDHYFEVMRKKGYHWFISSSTKTNGILIGLRNESFDFEDTFEYEKPSILTNQILVDNYLEQPFRNVIRDVIKNPELLSIDLPDFYEVRVKWKDTPLSFIGVRIKKDRNNDEGFKRNQFHFLDNYLSSLANNNQKYICVGDMNAWWPWPEKNWGNSTYEKLKETQKHSILLTPKYKDGEWWSCAWKKEGDTKPTIAQLDHMITNVISNYRDFYDKKGNSVKYYWNFINSLRYPVGITAGSPNKPVGLPDHAILKVELDI